MLSLLLLMLAGVPAVPAWSRVEVLGWTRDGTAVAFRGTVQSLERPDGVMPSELAFLVLATPDGVPERLYRLERRQPMDEVTWADEGAEDIWKAAGTEKAAKQWLEAHPLSPPPPGGKLGSGIESRNGGRRLSLRVTFEGKGCRNAALQAAIGSAPRALLRDKCPPDAENLTLFDSTAQIAWSPDGTRAAIGWNITRAYKTKPGAPPPVDSGHFTVLAGSDGAKSGNNKKRR